MSEETEPLIQDRDYGHGGAEQEAAQSQTRAIRIRAIVWSLLALIFIVGVIIVLVGPENYGDIGPGTLPRDPDAAARKLLDMAPVIVCMPYHDFQCQVTIIHFLFLRMDTLVSESHRVFFVITMSSIRSTYSCALWLEKQCLCHSIG